MTKQPAPLLALADRIEEANESPMVISVRAAERLRRRSRRADSGFSQHYRRTFKRFDRAPLNVRSLCSTRTSGKTKMNAIDQLKSVLCGPDGQCCIAGADEDRSIINRALAALAQPTQEPAFYGFMMEEECCVHICYSPAGPGGPNNELSTAYYTSPPQRQPLTDAEIWQMVNDCSFNRDLHADKFARAIEAKLKEKNV